MRQQFVVLDFLRFLTALCVLLFHYELFVRKGVALDDRIFGRFDAGVDFFFILSGFVIAHSTDGRLGGLRDYWEFLVRRLARIYPLHLATLAAAAGLALLATWAGLQIHDPGRYHPKYLLDNLLLIQAWGFDDRLSFNTVAWSISAEWFLYLTFPLTLWLVKRLGPIEALLAVVAVIVLMNITGIDFANRSYDAAMVRALPSFAIGIALWFAWRQINWQAPWWLVVASYAAAVLAMVFRLPTELLLAPFATCVLVTALAERKRPRFSSTMQTLGDASFGLYMLHLLVGFVVFGLHMNPILSAAVAAAVSVAGAIFSYRYFESPARKVITRLSVSKRPNACVVTARSR